MGHWICDRGAYDARRGSSTAGAGQQAHFLKLLAIQPGTAVYPASLMSLFAATFVLGAPSAGAALPPQHPKGGIGFMPIETGIILRRSVAHHPRPKGTVLLLHGFPETLQVWREISGALAADYEVHAFDWPGYGLSSRPTTDKFSYAPRDYAYILRQYVAKAGIDTSRLTIYATDIGALPVLLLALEDPTIARTIIVGDFAPFNRPGFMYESLQSLKSETSSHHTRIQMNRNREEILENTFRRGLPKEHQFEISRDLKDDMARGWSHGEMTTADAFFHYYSHFTRDQDYLEANLTQLKTPIKVVWGAKDIYIKKEMGIEFAEKANAPFILLPNMGHYPHLQHPQQTVEEIRASFR